mgnify:CR=1 FL=1
MTNFKITGKASESPKGHYIMERDIVKPIEQKVDRMAHKLEKHIQERGGNIPAGIAATIGGKLAQVGSRLIDGVAKKIATDFFNAFNKRACQG